MLFSYVPAECTPEMMLLLRWFVSQQATGATFDQIYHWVSPMWRGISDGRSIVPGAHGEIDSLLISREGLPLWAEPIENFSSRTTISAAHIPWLLDFLPSGTQHGIELTLIDMAELPVCRSIF